MATVDYATVRALSRVVLLLVGALLMPARAQAQPHEVFGGYSYLRESRTDVDFARGWSAAVAERFGRVWAVVEADGHYSHQPFIVGSADVRLHGLLAGGRVKARVGPFEEFVQLTAGGVWARGVAFGIESRDFRAVAQLGLGLDAPLSRHLMARLQVDGRSLPSARWKVVQLRATVGVAYVLH